METLVWLAERPPPPSIQGNTEVTAGSAWVIFISLMGLMALVGISILIIGLVSARVRRKSQAAGDDPHAGTRTVTPSSS